MSKVLILFAHPAFQKSRAQKHLVAATHSLDEVTFHDLYEAYPDFNIDVPLAQQLLRDQDLIVLQHPFYWYSCPALLKEWLDLVLEYGFAYGHQGTALEGKKCSPSLPPAAARTPTAATATTALPSANFSPPLNKQQYSAACATCRPT